MKMRIVELMAVFMIVGILLMNMRMPIGTAASQTDINAAIEKGLAYLNSTQAPDGSWGASSQFPVACTAMAVLAFENAPHSYYGWNASDLYNTTVQKGLDWLFAQGQNVTISNQAAGNPDSNGNGIGVYFPTDYGGFFAMYETPMVLLAIVASNAPTNMTGAGPLGVCTYHDIVQDIVDYIAWGQTDPGPGEGGWRYYANYPHQGSSDNSVSQWPVLALMAAHLWGIDAPVWVKSELNYWIMADQNMTGNQYTNSNYGMFGYIDASGSLGGVPETAAGILELTYVGAPSNNASIIAAEGYLNEMWNFYDAYWNVNIGSLYGMYAVMKAMRETTPTPTEFIAEYDGTPGVEWYNGTGQYADALLANQGTDGSWVNWKSWAEDAWLPKDLSSAFGVLILEYVPVKVTYTVTVHVVDASTNSAIPGANVTAVGPETLSGMTDGGTVTFNGTQAGSYVVSASKPGYTSASVNVSLTNDTEITIRLTPLATALSASIGPTSAKIKIGENVTFTSSASGGSPPYSYQWYLNGSAVSGATSSTWTFAPTSLQPIGNYTVYVIVTDNLTNTATSNTAIVTVAPPLLVSISPMSASMLMGQSVTFTSTTSGGYPPYSYQWYLNGNPAPGATSSTWTFTPTTPSTYYVYLYVIDTTNNTAQSDTARITFTQPPVGGYSVSIEAHAASKPLTPYLALTAILAIGLVAIKRKTPRRKK